MFSKKLNRTNKNRRSKKIIRKDRKINIGGMNEKTKLELYDKIMEETYLDKRRVLVNELVAEQYKLLIEYVKTLADTDKYPYPEILEEYKKKLLLLENY